MEKNDVLQEVAIALLSSAIAANPKRFAQIVQNHGFRPEPNDEDLAAQVAGLILDKKNFFLKDVQPAMYEVGFFDPISLGLLGGKLSLEGIKKVVDKVKENRALKKSNPEEAAKKEGLLKRLFGKMKGNKTEQDVANDPDTKELLKKPKTKDDEDKPKDTILGMNKTTFIVVAIVSVLLFILIIWLIVRMAKGKKQIAAAAA